MAEIGANVWDWLSSLSVHGHGVTSKKTDWTVCPTFLTRRIPHTRSEQMNTCKNSLLSSR